MNRARQSDVSEGPLRPEEFSARFQECSGVLWCLAASVLNDRSGIDDVLQESAMIALRKIDQFDPSTSLVAWCGRIVTNVARNHARRNRRRRGADVDLHLIAADQPRDEAQEETLLDRATLRPDQRHFDDALVQALERIDGPPG